MQIFSHPDFADHENVVFVADKETGLRAIIAIHSTRLGPAAGGCRIWRYESDIDALKDALRLSRGMSYKNAIAGLDLGGGKAVIMLRDGAVKTPALMRAFGRAVERLGGRYVTAEDVGASTDDMEEIRSQTSHVAGLKTGLFASGDPSPITARGVFAGIGIAVWRRLGRSHLRGVTVAVQGIGAVGFHLCELLHDAGAKLIVTDIDEGRLNRARERLGADVCDSAGFHTAACDVYAPCAFGGVLSEATVPTIRARIVAGAANNQLATEADADRLHQAGILYVPDFLINAGGILNVGAEIARVPVQSWTDARLSILGQTMEETLAEAERLDCTPHLIATIAAERRLYGARHADAA